jgi:hypothetical protein
MFQVPTFEPPKPDTKRPMFSAACEYFDDNGQMTHGNIVYTHAPDLRSAECSFRAIYSNELCSGRMRIIAVAPPVGWFVQDEHGEQLAG